MDLFTISVAVISYTFIVFMISLRYGHKVGIVTGYKIGFKNGILFAEDLINKALEDNNKSSAKTPEKVEVNE